MPLPKRFHRTCFWSGIAREWLSQYSITFSLMPSSILYLYAALHIRSQQAASSFWSIFTLNLVYLCSVFLEMWSNFDIVATIQFLEVSKGIESFNLKNKAFEQDYICQKQELTKWLYMLKQENISLWIAEISSWKSNLCCPSMFSNQMSVWRSKEVVLVHL